MKKICLKPLKQHQLCLQADAAPSGVDAHTEILTRIIYANYKEMKEARQVLAGLDRLKEKVHKPGTQIVFEGLISPSRSALLRPISVYQAAVLGTHLYLSHKLTTGTRCTKKTMLSTTSA